MITCMCENDKAKTPKRSRRDQDSASGRYQDADGPAPTGQKPVGKKLSFSEGRCDGLFEESPREAVASAKRRILRATWAEPTEEVTRGPCGPSRVELKVEETLCRKDLRDGCFFWGILPWCNFIYKNKLYLTFREVNFDHTKFPVIVSNRNFQVQVNIVLSLVCFTSGNKSYGLF